MKKVKKNVKMILLILLSITIVSSLLFVYACFAPYGRHKADNIEALKTDKIIDPPDSVAVIRGGVAIKVSDEKRDQIYAAFAKAFAEQEPRSGSCFCSVGKKRIAKCVLFNLNIEFRYDQRRRSNGYYYDVVLFSFDGNDLIPIFGKNGEYLDHLTYSQFWFDESYFSDFKKAIKEIL